MKKPFLPSSLPCEPMFGEDSTSIWYRARDLLVDANFATGNISFGLLLASKSQHPDAVWITKICQNVHSNPSSSSRLMDLVLAKGDRSDARTLCFSVVLDKRRVFDIAKMKKAALLGYAFAQSLCCGRTFGKERWEYATLAAGQGERDGYYWLGVCYVEGEGCKQDLEMGKECFRKAAELGDVAATRKLGLLSTGVKRINFLGDAARKGAIDDELIEFAVSLHPTDDLYESLAFAIGRALKNYISRDRIFLRKRFDFDIVAPKLRELEAFFSIQCQRTRKAVDMWALVGKRIGVVKDVRLIISRLIWEFRHEGSWRNKEQEQ